STGSRSPLRNRSVADRNRARLASPRNLGNRATKDHPMVSGKRIVAGAHAQRRVSGLLSGTLRRGGHCGLRVLITGAGGMVARALGAHCASLGDSVFPYDHQALDIADAERVMQALQRDEPE